MGWGFDLVVACSCGAHPEALMSPRAQTLGMILTILVFGIVLFHLL